MLAFPAAIFGNLVVPQGAGFTYQGRLNNGTNPACGDYDLRFTVFDNDTAGNILGMPITNSVSLNSNGVFTVTLDFGANVFDGANLWLEIGVRTNGSTDFSTFSNRQALTPTPYAIHALVADRLTGGPIVSGVGLTNLSGANVQGAVSEALYAGTATNAPDGNPLVSNVGVTNIVNSVITERTDIAHVFNVRDYGAVGDGFTDDTTAIQAAINAASSVGATNFGTTKVVYFPVRNHIHSYDQTPATRSNTYRVDGTIYVSAAGITLRGEVQSDVSTLATLFHTTASPCIVVGANGSPGGNMCQIEFLQIQGSGESDSRNVGISFQRGAQFKIKNCLMYWTGVGISLTNTFYATIEDCSLNSCGRAVDLKGAENTEILNTDMQENNQGIQSDGRSLYVANCIIGGPTHDNGNMTNAIRVVAGGPIARVTCVNSRFNVPGAKDGKVIGQFWTDQGGSFNFINCYFRNDYGGSNIVIVATSSTRTYINILGGQSGVNPLFGLTDVNSQEVFEQGDWSNRGTNAVLLTSGGAAYTGTTFAAEYRVTRPMRIDGNFAVNGTIIGNGGGISNLPSVWSTPVGTYGGLNFQLGTNVVLSSATNIYFSDFVNVSGSSSGETFGKMTLLATADILITNPPSWNARGLTSRTLTNGQTALITLTTNAISTNFIYMNISTQ